MSWKLAKMQPSELGKKLSLGQDVQISIQGSVIQEIVGDNQDGTVSVCYVVKPMITSLDEA